MSMEIEFAEHCAMQSQNVEKALYGKICNCMHLYKAIPTVGTLCTNREKIISFDRYGEILGQLILKRHLLVIKLAWSLVNYEMKMVLIKFKINVIF